MKPFNFFLILSFVVCLFAAFYGCKARKVDKYTAQTDIKSSSASETHEKTLLTDTGKSFSQAKTTTAISVNQIDSGRLKTAIYPKAGVQFVLEADGTFRGEADSVKTEAAGIRHRQKNGQQNHEESFDTRNGLSELSDKDAQQSANNHIANSLEEKHVTSKPDHSWILWAAGAFILCFLLYRFFKK